MSAESAEQWTPLPFDLRLGVPFTYSDRAISNISNTDAFNTGIDLRDDKKCIVCGDSDRTIQHAHIIPKVESDTVGSLTSSVTSILLKFEQWEVMRQREFIPAPAKSVQHEARNGILLCPSHHAQFDAYYFYIRWVPEVSVMSISLSLLAILTSY